MSGAATSSYILMLTGAALGLAASLLSGLPPLLAGAGAAAIFVCSLPVLGGLQPRLQTIASRFAAAGLMLLALYGFLG